MNIKVKKKIDQFLTEHNGEQKSSLLSLIKKVNDNLEWYFNHNDKGICSVIITHTTHNYWLRHKLNEIILSNKCPWIIGNNGFPEYVGDDRGTFVWKPKNIKVRKNFLTEIYNYIKENK